MESTRRNKYLQMDLIWRTNEVCSWVKTCQCGFKQWWSCVCVALQRVEAWPKVCFIVWWRWDSEPPHATPQPALSPLKQRSLCQSCGDHATWWVGIPALQAHRVLRPRRATEHRSTCLHAVSNVLKEGASIWPHKDWKENQRAGESRDPTARSNPTTFVFYTELTSWELCPKLTCISAFLLSVDSHACVHPINTHEHLLCAAPPRGED